MGERIILHCDLNSFYASVELLDKPALWEVPVAVCGDPKTRHGIILAKNEPAKKYGIQTAETVWQAKKKCPGLVLLPPHHDLYKMWSVRVNDIYERFTDLIEPFGIDESWLDVTNSLHLFGGDARALADTLRGRIKREFGLTISVGVSFNKVFAKLGSDYKKPDATTVISRENWRDMVWPLPVGDLLYVGRAARRTLAQYGVETIGQLAACKPEMLEQLMGKAGVQLHRYANGLDDAPVRPQHEHEPVKSVGNSTTFPENLTRWEQVRSGLQMLSDSVAGRLRQQGLTLSAAESCTGGLIAKRLTDVAAASAAILGGVGSYTNGVKAGGLGVPRDLLDRYGAVSAPVARAMAEDWGCVVLLKGTVTVISGPEGTYLTAEGNGGLAKGGSGDTLTGLILAMLCQGRSPTEGACLGSWLLGVSAEKAFALLKERMLRASDLAAALKTME